MPRLLPGLALVLLTSAPARADAPPVGERGPGLRDLAIRAEAVVVAVPADAVNPTTFVVREVLRGEGVRRGQRLTPGGLLAYQVQSEDPPAPLRKEPRPRRVVLAVLFLGAGGTPSLVPGGFRFCTEDGRVLAPRPGSRPNEPKRRLPPKHPLGVAEGVDWDAVLRQVREDVARVKRAYALKGLARPGRRNRALLDWLACHRADFGIPAESDSSWAELHDEVFRWVLEGGRLDDCWAALKLYAELNRGSPGPWRLVHFTTRAGRAFLLEKALDEKALDGDRARAVTLLGEQDTLFLPGSGRRAEPLGEKERDQILERLTPLVPLRGEAFRVALARTLRRLSRPEEVGLKLPPSKVPLSALVDAYKTAAPGEGRDELAEAVCALAEPSQWKALTGNPPGLLARLRDPSLEGGQLRFWVSLRPGSGKAYERPTLVLEKLKLLNIVGERKRLPLPAVNFPGPWSEGWDGADYLLAQVPLTGLTPGTWRVRVEGTVGKGKDKVPWTSEPRKFAIAQPSPGRRPGRYRYKY